VSADIQPNGQLALAEALSTRGIGAHGQVAANGPDALFSQGAIKASASGKVLAVVNVSITQVPFIITRSRRTC
jgi:hypothetical protein